MALGLRRGFSAIEFDASLCWREEGTTFGMRGLSAAISSIRPGIWGARGLSRSAGRGALPVKAVSFPLGPYTDAHRAALESEGLARTGRDMSEG